MFRFIGSRNKHRQYLCLYTYRADCWQACKEKYATTNGRYDFFAAHSHQVKIESRRKQPIANAIKALARELGINIRLEGRNDAHHFASDLYRRTGHVALNM